MRYRILIQLVFFLFAWEAILADPQPGDIFKEYVYKKKTDFFKGPFDHLDSVETNLSINDLAGATRVEIAFYFWGGHSGTSGQEFRANDGNKYKLTQPVGTPVQPECYYRTILGRSAVNFPLQDIHEGSNKFTLYCGTQICHSFNWPHYWIYKYIVRVYYEKDKSCAKGQLILPVKGQIIGDYPDMEFKAIDPDSVARVDFLAYYKGFDIDGDGKFRDWQYQVKDSAWTETAGLAIKPRYKEVWDNYWIPDQDSSIRFMAKITGTNGYVYMTESVDDIRLLRKDRSVQMYMPKNFPEVFGARKEQRKECFIPMEDYHSGKNITDAKLYVSSWSGNVDNEQPYHEIGINEQVIANKFGIQHDHSLNLLPVPVSSLRENNNIFIYSSFWGHALEINWPGPALLVERCINSNCEVTKCEVTIDDKAGSTPTVTFENALYKGVMRENPGGECGTENAIRDWTLKSNNLNQAAYLIDACAQRGPLQKASVIFERPDSAKIKLEYKDCKKGGINAISEYTIYRNSPFIKIDYVKIPDGWWNTVDIGRPGGGKYGMYKIFGQEDYIKTMQKYPDSYWNTHDKGYEKDPKDGGALNYKGYMIMLIGNINNGSGFGRIMPIKTDKTGGLKILKLLNGRGFETFPSTGDKAKPYSAAIFVFEDGLVNALAQAKIYIDKL